MSVHKTGYLIFGLLCVFLPIAEDAGAVDDIGRPLWRVFDTRDTGAGDISQTAIFDERGLIYAANESGILSFDGISWRLTSTGPAQSALNAILYLGDGSWLAGGPNVLGKFTPNATGAHTWQPISYSGAATDGFQESVLSFVKHDGNTYVITDQSMSLLVEDELTVVLDGTPTGFSFSIGARLFISDSANVYDISEQEPLETNVPVAWASLRPVEALNTNGDTIVITERSGAFKATLTNNAISLTPIWEVLPSVLEAQNVTAAAGHADGSYILGTEKGAVLHLDSNGNTLRQLDTRNGFYAGTVRAVQVRADGDVIAFFDGGAAWLDLSDTRRVWDAKNGLVGSVTAIALSEGTLFAGTDLGVYRTGAGRRMRLMNDVGVSLTHTLNVFKRSNIEAHTSLLVGRDDGLFDYFDNQLRPIAERAPLTVFVSRTQPARIAVGFNNSVSLFEFERGEWTDLGRLGPLTDHPIVEITETAEGDLIAIQLDGTATRFLADQWLSEKGLENILPADVQAFPRKSLSTARPIVASYQDNIHLLLPRSGLKWDIRTEKFTADTVLATELSHTPQAASSLWHSAAHSGGLLWLQSHHNSFVLDTQRPRLTRLPTMTNGTVQFNTTFIDQGSGRALFATPDGISSIPVDWPNITSQKQTLPALSLRNITVDGDQVYQGEGEPPSITLSPQTASLTMQFALLDWQTSCGDPGQTLDIMATNTTSTEVPLSSDCSISLSGAQAIEVLGGTTNLRLSKDEEPISMGYTLQIKITQPWFARSFIPAILALALAALSIAGGRKPKRVWPEPIRRFLALLSGLLLCFAAALGASTIPLTAGLVSFTSWLLGLLVLAFLLPIFTEGVMRMGDRRSPSAR